MSTDLPAIKKDIVQAEKREGKQRGWFASLFKKKVDPDETDPYGLTAAQRQRFTEAIPVLQAKAGQSVSLNNWREASDEHAFLARTYLLLGKRGKCSSHFVNAANCLANEAQRIASQGSTVHDEEERQQLELKITEALTGQTQYLRQACEESQIAGHYTTAAGILEDLSKIQCDSNRPQTYDPVKGVETLKEAASIYVQTGAVQHAIDCLVKLAIVCQREENFTEAEDLWNECVRHSSDVKILQASVIKYQVSFLLCRIVHLYKTSDPDNIDASIDKMNTSLDDCLIDNPQFTPIRFEHQLILSVIELARVHGGDKKALQENVLKPHGHLLLPHHVKLLQNCFGEKEDKKKSFFSWR